MQPLENTFIDCPYCGERIEILIDASVDLQDYIEDCSVCCRPIVLTVMAEDGEIGRIEVRAEDD
jgi:Cysteine-rich CPXCG